MGLLKARAPLSQPVNGNGLDRGAVGKLLSAMKAKSGPIKPARLGVIGRTHFEARFAAAGCQMESFDYKCIMDTTDGVPWIVAGLTPSPLRSTSRWSRHDECPIHCSRPAQSPQSRPVVVGVLSGAR